MKRKNRVFTDFIRRRQTPQPQTKNKPSTMTEINGSPVQLTSVEADAAVSAFQQIIKYPTVSSTAAASGGKML
jgi:hypothetical protein